ncbi:MAG TPA: hypothetical protein VEA44_18255 [Caulobacter sp.]|nr:hypothetical protein [Caulobacter sp.]
MQRVILTACVSLAVMLPAIGAAAPAGMPKLTSVDETAGKLTWVDRPNILEIRNVADGRGIGNGSGEVECTLGANGRPKACTIVSETPKGRYGTFLSEVAALYKAGGKDANGQPTEGRKVRVSFTMGEDRAR